MSLLLNVIGSLGIAGQWYKRNKRYKEMAGKEKDTKRDKRHTRYNKDKIEQETTETIKKKIKKSISY